MLSSECDENIHCTPRTPCSWPCHYYRYASLYFCCAVEDQDNELITLEIIHRYVELLDKYFGSVSFLVIVCLHFTEEGGSVHCIFWV